MEDEWKLIAVLAGAAAVGAWLMVARSLRKRRLAGLEPIARELGLFFHGGTFRGRFEGHAVRGDGESDIPRLEAPTRASLFDLFTSGPKAVRVRLELMGSPVASGSGQSEGRAASASGTSPDATRAVAAARKDLRDRGTDARLFEVALQGTELVFVLRGEAATPEAVRRVVEKALRAARRG